VRVLIRELQHQRKLTTSVHSEEDQSSKAQLVPTESNKQIVDL
jgi:hypothetical protein